MTTDQPNPDDRAGLASSRSASLDDGVGLASSRSSSLAAHLGRALEQRHMTMDELSARTKVPRTTLRALFGHDDLVVLPSRVYLRAHLKLVIEALALDRDETLAAFDRAFPETQEVAAP